MAIKAFFGWRGAAVAAMAGAAFALCAETLVFDDIDTTVSDSFWNCTGRVNTEADCAVGGAAAGETVDMLASDTVSAGGIGTAESPFDTCMRATDEAVLTGKFSSLPVGATVILR